MMARLMIIIRCVLIIFIVSSLTLSREHSIIIDKVTPSSIPAINMQFGGKTVMEGSFIAFRSVNKEGLLCSCSSIRRLSGCLNGSWNYPNGTKISAISHADQYFSYEGSYNTDVSLFYKGSPLERGKFTCTWSGFTFYVYIIDLLNQTDPIPRIVLEGDDTEFSVSVDIAHIDNNTEDIDSQVMYQWQKNGVDVKNGDLNKYRGTQHSANLSIFNVQKSDEGLYRCMFPNIYLSDRPLVTEEVNLTVVGSEIFLTFKGTNQLNGVVLFDDIHGDESPQNGILCSTTHSKCCSDQFWSYENGTRVPTEKNVLNPLIAYEVHRTYYVKLVEPAAGRGTKDMYLFKDGNPPERGLFKCTLKLDAFPLVEMNASVYIIDMEISDEIIGPNIVLAGDTVEFSVNVSVQNSTNNSVAVPYQWQKDGKYLVDGDKYNGTQTAILTIFNTQTDDQGIYNCSYAAARQLSKNLTVVTITVEVDSNTNLKIGSHCTLTCNYNVIGISLDGIDIQKYTWYKVAGVKISNNKNLTLTKLNINDSVNYYCRVDVSIPVLNRNVSYTSDNYTLKFSDARYQVYLNNVEDCYEWTEKHITKKEKDVKDIITNWMEHQCQINFTDQSNFMKDNNYRCPKDFQKHVMYDVYLHESEVSITALVSCLNQWLKDTDTVTVNSVELDINKTCSRLDDNLTPECSDEHTTVPPVTVNCKRDQRYYGIGFAICGLVIGIILGGVFTAGVMYKYNKRHPQYRVPDHP